MKKYFYGVITMFSILLITIFFGCYQNPDFSPKSEMGFVVKLPSITNKKTIYYTQDDVSYYKLILKMEDKEIDSKTGKPGEILKFVVNEEGLYSFYIAAYNSNDVTIAEGFASQKISLIDGMVNVRLTLYPKIKEIDVDIEIEWNEDNINYASEGIVIGEKLFSKTSEIYVIPKESGNKTVIGKNSSGPFVEGRKVVLSPYVMGQYEVTQELFEVIMGVNPSENISISETENINLRPVDSANWYQVIAFCNKLSILQNLEPVYSVDGITDWENLPFESIPTNSDSAWNYVAIDLSKNGYRLPTEAEWEYAARGGDVESSYWDTLFAGGNGASLLAWTYENSDYKSHEVGLKKPNSLGLYDLSGNVWEWCNDLYAYDMEISDNEVINPINSGLGNYRVQRGGCWKDSEYFSVVSYRRDDSCGGGVSSYWSDWGFRLCRSLTNTGSIDDTEYNNGNVGGDSYENVKEIFNYENFYLRGNMNNWCNDEITDGSLTKNDDGTFSIIYVANCMEDEFCIADSFWSKKFCGVDVSVGNDFIELIPYAGANAKIINQVPGNSYKMTIEPLESTVRVKIELYEKNIPSFYIKDTKSEINEMIYDRTSYTYQFTATSEIETFSLWSDNSFYLGDITVNSESELSVCNECSETTISGLIPNKEYDIILYILDDEVYINVLQHCPYFIVGSFSYNGDNVWERMSVTDIDNVYYYEFIYNSSMSETNSSWWYPCPENGIVFDITYGNGNFDNIYGNVELSSEYVISNGSEASSAVNLIENKTYVIYLKVENGFYYAKIEEK